MKRLLCLLAIPGALLCSADLAGVRSVYILPMARGLDQYVANHVAGGAVFQVVTDPKLADAVLTDRIGQGFEIQMDDIFRAPEEAEEAKPGSKPEARPETAKPAKSAEKQEPASGGVPFFGDTVNKVENPALNSAWGRSKGNIFLVDAKSRQVLWSTYDPPKSSAPKDLDRTASDIVSRLKKVLNPKK